MASTIFDASELDAYARNLLRFAQAAPKRQQQFMRKEGDKLRRKTLKRAKSIGKKTGSYLNSIKKGKVYRYQGDALAVRVYSSTPHAHLIEDGHRIVTRSGEEKGFAPGHHVFENGSRDFAPQYLADIDDMLDEAVREL